MNNLFTEVLEHNIKFKVLLNEIQEETCSKEKKEEINLQLSLLTEILEKKLILLKENEKNFNLDYAKLGKDTKKLIEKYKRNKNSINLAFSEDFSSEKYENNCEPNLLDDQNFQDIVEVIYDKDEEIKNILNEVKGLNTISKETAELILKNSENLDLIEYDIDNSKTNSEKVVQELKVGAKETIKRRKNYIKIFFTTLGGLIGIQAGPVGVGVGAVAGGAVGGLTSLSLNPLQNKISKIDEKK